MLRNVLFFHSYMKFKKNKTNDHRGKETERQTKKTDSTMEDKMMIRKGRKNGEMDEISDGD